MARCTKLACIAAVCACLAARAAADGILDLSSSAWTLINANKTLSLPANVPGYALETLAAAGKIPSPLKGFGELHARWVALESAWTWRTSFMLPASLAGASSESVFLSFGGLDTFATVTLNGKTVLRANNFHRCGGAHRSGADARWRGGCGCSARPRACLLHPSLRATNPRGTPCSPLGTPCSPLGTPWCTP